MSDSFDVPALSREEWTAKLTREQQDAGRAMAVALPTRGSRDVQLTFADRFPEFDVKREK